MPRQTRNTRQKEIISKTITTINDFFTAEELFEIIKKTHQDVSLATIYRILKKLKEDKEVYSYICENKTIYSKDKRSHCHFICEETGKIIHFDVNSLDFLKDKIPGKISSFQIEVKGRCTSCCNNKD